MPLVCRDRPVPIPGPGVQLTTLSHVEDLAALLATVPGNSAAVKQHFNLCSDRCITFDGVSGGVGPGGGGGGGGAPTAETMGCHRCLEGKGMQ